MKLVFSNFTWRVCFHLHFLSKAKIKIGLCLFGKIQLHTTQSLQFPWCRKRRTSKIGFKSKIQHCFYILPPLQLILFARGLVVYRSFSTFPVNILSIIVEFIECLKFLNNVSIFFRIIPILIIVIRCVWLKQEQWVIYYSMLTCFCTCIPCNTSEDKQNSVVKILTICVRYFQVIQLGGGGTQNQVIQTASGQQIIVQVPQTQQPMSLPNGQQVRVTWDLSPFNWCHTLTGIHEYNIFFTSKFR